MNTHSFAGEDAYVLDRIKSGTFVDLGAGDGSTWSNSLLLVENGWTGLCVDYDRNKFAHLSELHSGKPVVLRNDKITVENVCSMLDEASIPGHFEFLSVDIDGMDAWVIEEILGRFSPEIIIAEFNHLVPPPIRFCMNYDPDFKWGVDHLFGASVQHLTDIIEDRGYGLDKLFLNNAAFVRGAPKRVLATNLWDSDVVPAAITNAGMHSIPHSWPRVTSQYVDELDKLFGGGDSYVMSLNRL